MTKKVENYTSSVFEEIQKQISPHEQYRVEKRMLLATKIDDAMKAKGLKKKDLVNALTQNRSAITKWLSGTHNFTSDTLCDIEGVLDIEHINVETKQDNTVNNFYISFRSKSKGVNSNKLGIPDSYNDLSISNIRLRTTN